MAKSRLVPPPYIADFNKDGIKDMVVFTQNKDSLFIETFDYYKEASLVDKRFITIIGGFNEYDDFTINIMIYAMPR